MCIQVFTLSRAHFPSFFFPSLVKGATYVLEISPTHRVELLLHPYLLDSSSYGPSRELSTHFQVLKLSSPDPVDLILFCY